MIKVAIVEDEQAAADTIRAYLERYTQEKGELFRVTHYANAMQLLVDYSGNDDLIFMDIEMPHLNGMEASREIRRLDRDVVIVFITNMAQYAVQGYEVGAFDFVVKPVSYYDFAMKLERSIEKIRQADERSLAIPLDGGVRKITVSRIRYVEVMKHRLTYHTEDGVVEAGGSLRNLEEILPAERFVRCSNSYLVNLRYVDCVEDFNVHIGDEVLPISRAKKKEFLAALNRYLNHKV